MYRQKGTGKPRRGDRRSPLLKGGGVSWGPKPRDFSLSMHKKEHSVAIGTALQNVAENNDLVVVPSMHQYFEVEKKTTALKSLLDTLELPSIKESPHRKSSFINDDMKQRALIITPILYYDLYVAARPLRYVTCQDVYNIQVKDILNASKVFLDAPAFRYLNRVLATELYVPNKAGQTMFQTTDFEPYTGDDLARFQSAEDRLWPKGTDLGMVLGDKPLPEVYVKPEWKSVRKMRRMARNELRAQLRKKCQEEFE